MKISCALLFVLFFLCSCDKLYDYRLVLCNNTSNNVDLRIENFNNDTILVRIPPAFQKLLISTSGIGGAKNQKDVNSLKKILSVETLILSCRDCDVTWEMIDSSWPGTLDQRRGEDFLG